MCPCYRFQPECQCLQSLKVITPVPTHNKERKTKLKIEGFPWTPEDTRKLITLKSGETGSSRASAETCLPGPETPGPELGGTLTSYSDGLLESGCGLDERQKLFRIVSSSWTYAFNQYGMLQPNALIILFYTQNVSYLGTGSLLNWFLRPCPMAAVVLP